KYLVLTTKHHDGFCLWNTKYTDYNIMNTPFRRDVTRELADACRKHGIMFCAYYSIADWYHPDYPMGSPRGRTKKPNPNMDRYFLFMKNQLTELLTNYGPLGVLWFDGEWGEAWTTERGIELYEYLKQLQPSLIINNRISKARKGIEGVSTPGQFAGDFDTPEQRIGAFQMQRPWETCMTLGTQWAWKPDDKIKSLTECLQALVRTAGGDGNFLFNVGPMPTGEIEPRQAERLKEMGAWLAKHGNAIYGTRGGPYKPARHVVSTRKDNKVFLHILAWPEQTLTLPALPAKLLRASPGVQQTDAGLAITVPAEKRDPIDTIITLELDRPAIELEPISIAPHQ
ncbi:MAG: alpha-L-fucosidase, partial [Verrucomicrobiae bacterium]|nr:alpha-L-fucosidase [Verrucomicrobiae bacterium]